MIILDTETTGLGPDSSVIELAIADANVNLNKHYPYNLEIRHTYDEYFTPIQPLTFDAMAINHITPERLENKPKLRESSIFGLFSTYNGIIVGHNIQYDLDALRRDGLELKGNVVDTLRCTQHLLSDLPKYNLQYLRYALGLYKAESKEHPAHNALGDVYVTANLLAYLLDKVDNNIEKLIELTSTPVVLKYCTFKKHKGETWESVAQTDRQYLTYLLDNLTDMNEDLKHTLQYYLEDKRQQMLY